MKKINLTLGFLIAILSFSCSSDTTLLAQSKYKGPPKYQQPNIEIFPNSTEYILDQGLGSNLELKLNQKIDELFDKHNIAGITATILIPEKGIWEINKGFISKPDNKLVDNTSVFYWASVGKLITSTIIHQLVIENKISFNDKISTWFPDIENAKKITIEQLLNHTNGISSFNSDPDTQNDKKSFSSPEELLEVSKRKKNLFKPGKYWSYTNTGYLLLALISEKIESKTFKQIVKERIAEPLYLKSLVALEENPSNLALAHDKNLIVHEEYSVPLGAGNVVSNSKDMTVFLSSLLTGKIIPIEMLHAMMKDLYPMFDNGQYYGKGIMLYNFKEIDNTNNIWIGHSGGTENYKTILMFDIKTKIIMAISINENIPAQAIAYKLVELINE